jgi:hypothetical protein
MSKKLSKIFLKAFAMTANIQKYLKAVKKFLCIKDSLQQMRLEWIFGV